jgi:hypothetical protein
MRYMRPAIAIAAVTLLAACSANTAISTPPEKSSASSAEVVRACDQPIVAVISTASEKAEFTAIRRVTENRSDSTVLLDSSFTARVDWDVPPETWVQNVQVQEAIQEAVGKPLTGETGTLAAVDEFLNGIAEPATHLGYAAVTPISIDMMVTCANIPRVLGTVHTWDLSNIGAVTCDKNTPRGDGAEPALRAKELYCN